MFRILFLLWLSFHPVHVSLVSLEYVPDKESFKGFVRIYLDDFLLDCACGIQQEKLIAGEKAPMEALETYLNNRLIIRVNNKTIIGEINDVEVNDNEVNINLRYNNRGIPETVSVSNLIMTGLYKDQSNMVILKVEDFEEGVKLTSEITEQTFKVN